MSIEIMTEVWKSSKQAGSALLLLLAIGDFADDAGFAWPGVSTLARRTRMDERSVLRLIKRLRSACELYVFRRGNLGNRYVVLCGCSLSEARRRLRLARHKVESDDKRSPGKRNTATAGLPAGMTAVSGTRVTAASGIRMTAASGIRMTRVSPDPSPEPPADPSAKGIAGREETPGPKPPKKRKPSLSQDPAIKVFREITHRYPAQAWHQDIVDAVGEDVEKWRGIVKEWVGWGWNPANVKGMLEVYRDGWSFPGKNGSGDRPAGTPGTIPKGMEKQSRTDIRQLTPEQEAAAVASILAQMRAQRRAAKERENEHQNAA